VAKPRQRSKTKSCSYCKAAGHYVATCDARKADLARADVIDIALARRQLDAPKHPAHWERLAANRAAVAEALAAALDDLAERAPAVKHIRKALELLEQCK
jgi:hypothetical protein